MKEISVGKTVFRVPANTNEYQNAKLKNIVHAIHANIDCLFIFIIFLFEWDYYSNKNNFTILN